ncbi:hypothetical protein FZ928_25085 [Klebsiella pneumoniae]|uniref:histidine kinase n=1 Tax=Klebsiella pneumoniae TaxID=573 RepID=A0A5C2LK90_KLEPN|nr:hypothetical protein FZ928_25085 [Klebsiella pneumoniae]
MDQLLTLSRLDSLAQLDDVQQVAIADLLQSAVMEMYHPAQQSGIELRLHLNASHIVRTGQPLLLSLLVRNLLDNAVRYSPRGSRSISRSTPASSGCAITACISPQALSRIGERFYRPPGQEAPGSGGLSIVRRIASLHGMQVDFANARDGGFEARVYW